MSFVLRKLEECKTSILVPKYYSNIQPLDQGAICSFKLEHRHFVLRRLLSLIDCDKKLSEIIKPVTVLDAILGIRHGWENLKERQL